MNKIITAMGNLNLNERLKKENDFLVYPNDILYKEAILEILEKNKEFNILIINDNLPGEISFKELINKIKNINKNIKIIFIIEKENELVENLFNEKYIEKIFYNNKINLDEFIYFLKNNKNNEEELKQEIENLKEIILKNNEELLKYKNNNLINENNSEFLKDGKIISVTGLEKSGKTTVSYGLANNLDFEKILIIDFDFLNAKDFRNKFYRRNIKRISKKLNSDKKYTNNYILKIDNKINVLFNFEDLLINKENNFEKLIYFFINKYDLIIVDLNLNNSFKNQFLNISNKIFFIIEAEMCNIYKNKKVFNDLISQYENDNVKIFINKYNSKSIDKNIIKNVFSKNVIATMRLKKNNNLLFNKNIRKIKKIIK